MTNTEYRTLWAQWIDRVNAHMARTGESFTEAQACLGFASRRVTSHKRVRGLFADRTPTRKHGPVRARTVSPRTVAHIVRARKGARGMTLARTTAAYIASRPCNTHTHKENAR